MPENIFIYGLRETGCDEFRYVGRTVDPVNRLSYHWSSLHRYSLKNPKRKWMTEVRNSGKQIEFIPLEECRFVLGAEREAYWYEYYKSKGCRLTNTLSFVRKYTPKKRYKIKRIAYTSNNIPKIEKSLPIAYPVYSQSEIINLWVKGWTGFRKTSIESLTKNDSFLEMIDNARRSGLKQNQIKQLDEILKNQYGNKYPSFSMTEKVKDYYDDDDYLDEF